MNAVKSILFGVIIIALSVVVLALAAPLGLLFTLYAIGKIWSERNEPGDYMHPL